MERDFTIKDIIAFVVFVIALVVLANVNYKLSPIALLIFMNYLLVKKVFTNQKKINLLLIIIMDVIFISIILLNYFYW